MSFTSGFPCVLNLYLVIYVLVMASASQRILEALVAVVKVRGHLKVNVDLRTGKSYFSDSTLEVGLPKLSGVCLFKRQRQPGVACREEAVLNGTQPGPLSLSGMGMKGGTTFSGH